MTENNKPEWFEIAESDGEIRTTKTRRSIPVTAIIAAALVIGIGTVVAQTQEETPASATESTPAPTVSTSAKASSPASTSANSEAIANPKITRLPTRGDEEGDHKWREDHGDRPLHRDGDQPPHPEGDDD